MAWGPIFVKSIQGLSLSSNTLFPPLLKGTFSTKPLDEEFELGLSLIWEDPLCGFSPVSMVYLDSVVLPFGWTVHKGYPVLVMHEVHLSLLPSRVGLCFWAHSGISP